MRVALEKPRNYGKVNEVTSKTSSDTLLVLGLVRPFL